MQRDVMQGDMIIYCQIFKKYLVVPSEYDKVHLK